jgi:hypothetical protein
MNPPVPYDALKARLACQLSADVYLPFVPLQEKYPSAIFIPGDCEKVMVWFNAGITWVVFEGTHDLASLLQDFEVKRQAIAGGGSLHSGFVRGVEKIWEGLFDFLRKFSTLGCPLIFSGHSAGATKAIIAASRWEAERVARPEMNLAPIIYVLPFAPARPGDAIFRARYNAALGNRTWCFQHGADIVPWEPPYLLGNRGVGHCVWFDAYDSEPILDPGLLRMALYCGAVTYAGWRKRPPQIEQLADHHVNTYLRLFSAHERQEDSFAA